MTDRFSSCDTAIPHDELEELRKKSVAYDALLAEAAKIQPSAEEVANALMLSGTIYHSHIVRIIERERLLGVLRERALRGALEFYADPGLYATRSLGDGEYEKYIGDDEGLTAQEALDAAPPASDALSKAIQYLRGALSVEDRSELHVVSNSIHVALCLLGEKP